MREGFGLLARLVTGGVWLAAGALKLSDPYASVRSVRAYRLLPEAVVPTVGHLLAAVEIVVGLAVLVGVLTRWSATVSALLFAAFVVAIASVWVRGIEIDCGCFGGGGAEAGASAQYPWEIARDTALLLLSGWLIRHPRTRLALDSQIFRTPERSPDAHEADVADPV